MPISRLFCHHPYYHRAKGSLACLASAAFAAAAGTAGEAASLVAVAFAVVDVVAFPALAVPVAADETAFPGEVVH